MVRDDSVEDHDDFGRFEASDQERRVTDRLGGDASGDEVSDHFESDPVVARPGLTEAEDHRQRRELVETRSVRRMAGFVRSTAVIRITGLGIIPAWKT